MVHFNQSSSFLTTSVVCGDQCTMRAFLCCTPDAIQARTVSRGLGRLQASLHVKMMDVNIDVFPHDLNSLLFFVAGFYHQMQIKGSSDDGCNVLGVTFNPISSHLIKKINHASQVIGIKGGNRGNKERAKRRTGISASVSARSHLNGQERRWTVFGSAWISFFCSYQGQQHFERSHNRHADASARSSVQS